MFETTPVRIVLVAALYALLAAALTLVGWIADVPRLLDWANTGITLKANNAVATVLNALALLSLAVPVRHSLALSRVLASGAGLIGGLTLFEHLAGVDLGIDTLLLDEPSGARATVAPGRMGPIASAAHLFIGCGVLLCAGGLRARRIAYTLGLLTFALSGIPLLGYLYGADFLYAIPSITGIAFQTTTILMALAIGLMALVPEHGVVAVLRREGPGGMLLRRAIVPLIVIPLLLGWLRLIGEQQGLYDAAFGTALLTFLLIALLIALATWGAERVAEATSLVAQQKEHLHTTLSSIGDGVIATDTHGVVTLMNGVAEALTGWRSAEAIGQPLANVFRIVNERTRGEVDSPVVRALRDGVIVGLANHTVLIAKDGVERSIDDSAAPIRLPGGQPIGCVLIFRDVTERRKYEQALLEADRRKDEFLATLAHELRNPLTPIRNSLHILRRVGSDREARDRFVEMTERQVTHLVRLVDDLLEVSRITRGKIELRKETVDLTTVLRSAVDMVRPHVHSSAHRLLTRLPAEPLWVHADPVRLIQILTNLLNNAIKYTGEGGSQIRLTARREDDIVVVSVRDKGTGISPEMLPRVFDLFVQGEQGLARTGGGLGVGLALAKRLVELHGGTIGVKSEGKNKGSEFWFTLPLADLPDCGSVPLKRREKRRDGIRRRILIVDDNHDAADTVAELLQSEGYDVATHYNGYGVEQKASDFKPDVAILDIGLPEIDGYEVARRLRRLSSFGALRLIALTGYGYAEDLSKAKAAGFNAHLLKPADPEKLINCIESLLARAESAN